VVQFEFQRGKYTSVRYARFADDLLILIDSHPRRDWLMKAVEKRIREEMAKLRVEINEEKSRIVDVAKGGSFSFLGFEYRRILSRNRKWRAYYAPKLKKRTALLAKLREIFRQNVSQPVGQVIEQINPILRGWVNYFAIGDSSGCFSLVRDWVERNYQGKDNVLLFPLPTQAVRGEQKKLRCRERLGGLLKYYEREAA
jgi:RNA-directed DNA polymerase